MSETEGKIYQQRCTTYDSSKLKYTFEVELCEHFGDDQQGS